MLALKDDERSIGMEEPGNVSPGGTLLRAKLGRSIVCVRKT